MRILFDEDAPRPLRRHLVGHDVKTVQEMGWAGVQNGELLKLVADHGFDVLLTFDQNLRYQQNLKDRPFAVVVVIAQNKRLDTLLPLVPQLLSAFSQLQVGEVFEVSAD